MSSGDAKPRFRLASRVGVGAAAACLLLLGTAIPSVAAAGHLDSTFGGDGKVTTRFRQGGIWAVAIQTDGKIVVAGQPGNTGDGSASAFGLARYNADGTLDDTFGGDGKVRTDLTRFADFAYAVAIQTDGKIIAAGGSGWGGRNAKFALVRYKTDGSLDTTFGGDGKVTTDFGRHGDFADGVAIQSDGKIVAAGVAGADGNNPRFALARYGPHGALDSTFGGSGRVRTDFTRKDDEALGLVIQGDGKIVTAGYSGGANPNFALARYTTRGRLDVSFGGDGKVTTDFSRHEDFANALAIQNDGKIVAAGSTSRNAERFALARYDTDGTLDTSFGGDGKVTTDFTFSVDEAHAVAIQADGRIVAVGLSYGEINGKFALARYNTHGRLDTSFGGDGKVTTDFTPGLDDPFGVAIQPDGRIVAAGVAGVDIAPRFAVARYRQV